MKELKTNYEKAVQAYVINFCERVEIDFDGWVGGQVGTVGCFGDHYFDFHDIKYFVENDFTFEIMMRWYWFTAEHPKCYINLPTFHKRVRDAAKSEFFDFRDFEKNLIYERVRE